MRSSLILLAFLLPLSSCATADARQGATEVATTPVNEVCPLMGEPVDPAIHATFEGRMVAFCCEDCLEEWGVMSDAERREALADLAR